MPPQRLFPAGHRTRSIDRCRRVFHLALGLILAAACDGNRQDIVAPDRAPRSGITAAGAKEPKQSVVIVTHSSGAVEGRVFTVQPRIELQSKGKRLKVNTTVTASLVNENVAQLGGTTTVQAVGGAASFTNLSIDITGTYIIEFAATGFNPARDTLFVAERPDEVTNLAPVADTYVRADAPTTNFGTLTSEEVRSEDFEASATSYVYLRFNLSSIPAGAEIREASLTMTAFNGYAHGGNGNVYVHFVTDDTWTETGAVWSTRPAQSSEAMGFWWLFYDGVTPSDQTGQLNNEALRARVEVEYGGDGLLSVMLRSPGYNTYYYSREAANSDHRPVLSVRYKPGP